MNKRAPILWLIASAIGTVAQIMMGSHSGLLLILTMVVGLFALNRLRQIETLAPKAAANESPAPLGVIGSFIKFNAIFAGMAIGGTFLMLFLFPDLGKSGGGIGFAYLIAFTYPLFLLSWVVWVLGSLWSNRRKKP
jgi:hypothetical protein